MVFKAGMTYFPKKKGISLLFHKDNHGDTPFQLACEKYGKEKVIEVIENVLADCSNTPYNTAHALISAAIDDDIDLDGVFFLLRREPDVLQKLLFPASSDNNNDNNNDNDNKNNSGNDHDKDDDDDGSPELVEIRKRKRGRTINDQL